MTNSPLPQRAAATLNTGFCLGKLIGVDNELALQIGVGMSGYYVHTAESPSMKDLSEFLQGLS